MSHEIRTPMNAILGITEILLHDEKLPQNVSEGLGKIYNFCDLLLGIINDILDFSKIEAGRLDIVSSEYNIASVINDSVHLNMIRIENKPIQLELDIDENIPSKLIGDEIRLKQILNYLLSNAFKYTDSGKITLTFNCEPYTNGIMLIIKVQDTGHGMTKEQIEKLFNEYYRFAKTKTTEGAGLGLAITQKLLALMNGKINVESEPGKGSLFTVYLPQGTVDDEVLGAEIADSLKKFRQTNSAIKPRTKIIRDPMPYGRVLIVDDVETNIDVAVGLLKLYKIKADSVTNGFAAIEKIKAGNTYDIIFMDHMMPDLDGIETTKRIRDLEYTQPIVALTANAVAGIADMFLQNGFDDFISKPINLRQLDSVLNRLIRDKYPPEVVLAARESEETQRLTEGSDLSAMVEQQVNEQMQISFLRDAEKTSALLEELLQTNALKTEDGLRKFTVSIHGIKSSLWNIGEKELSKEAQKLEMRAREGSASLDTTDINKFLESLNTLLRRMNAKHENDNDVDDIEEIKNALISIKETCNDYDREGVFDILDGIKKCSKETKKVLEKIRNYVTHSEFDEAGDFADAYAQEMKPKQKKYYLQ